MFGMRHRPTITDPYEVLGAHIAGALAISLIAFIGCFTVGFFWFIGGTRSGFDNYEIVEDFVGRTIIGDEALVWLVQGSTGFAALIFLGALLDGYLTHRRLQKEKLSDRAHFQ